MTRLSSILAAVALTLSTGANAALITVSTSTGGIYDVDTSSGAATLVANDSSITLTDIAMDASGNLWGVDFNNLYSIDVSTNTFTNMGSFGSIGMNALTFNDGTLFGASYANGDIYSIDTSTGVATTLGTGGYVSAGDLAFDSAGALFLAADTGTNDTVVLVDTGTWASSPVGPTGIDTAYGLAFVDGVMYGVSATNNIYTIDTSTGHATLLSTITGISGDVYGASVSAVPVPAAVWLFASGLLGLIGFSRKRV